MQPIYKRMENNLLLAATEWACKKLFYSIDRSRMNTRSISEALDDKIMGDIATIAIADFIRSQGYQAVAYDQIRIDNFHEPDPGWDLALGKQGLNCWAKTTTNPKLPPKDLCFTLSVRSSRLVRDEPVEQAIMLRDFKIFALNPNDIRLDLTADIEAQVYYSLKNTQLNNLTIERNHVFLCSTTRENCQVILEGLDVVNRFSECILTAWNFSETIANDSTMQARRTWSSFGKKMWLAPLRNGKSFNDIFIALDKL